MHSHPEKIVSSKGFAYFLQLSKTMNYTQTAKMLGITQPALTQQVKRLEKSVGKALFYSAGKQLHLTEAGKTLQKMIEDIYEIVAEATEAIQLENDEKRGKIRIGISASIEEEVFTDFLIDYYRKFPNVQIDLLVIGYQNLWDGFAQNKLDMAVLYLPEEEEEIRDFQVIPIAKDEIVFLHPRDVFEGQTAIPYADAMTYPWVSYPYSYFVFQVLANAFKKQHKNLPESVAHFTKPAQLLKFSNEVGVCTALPRSYYLAHKEEVSLAASSFEPKITMELSFILQKEKLNVPRIAQFIAHFEDYLQKIDYLNLY